MREPITPGSLRKSIQPADQYKVTASAGDCNHIRPESSYAKMWHAESDQNRKLDPEENGVPGWKSRVGARTCVSAGSFNSK